jgi:hypothetical protein
VTSNAWLVVIEKGGTTLGFLLDTDHEEEQSYNRITNLVCLALS